VRANEECASPSDCCSGPGLGSGVMDRHGEIGPQLVEVPAALLLWEVLEGSVNIVVK
jgi:hypothetical protein